MLRLPCSAHWGNMPAAEYETGTLTIAVMQSDAFGTPDGNALMFHNRYASRHN